MSVTIRNKSITQSITKNWMVKLEEKIKTTWVMVLIAQMKKD